MTDKTKLVQPIVVCTGEQVKPYHEDVVAAVAAASVGVYDKLPNEPVWADWLAATMEKTTRRVDADKFDKLAKQLEGDVVIVGNSLVVAGLPRSYSDFTRDLERARVAGTDFARIGMDEIPSSNEEVSLVVNEALNLTTGKEATEVAHAAWRARQLGLTNFGITRVGAYQFAKLRQDALFTVQYAEKNQPGVMIESVIGVAV